VIEIASGWRDNVVVKFSGEELFIQQNISSFSWTVTYDGQRLL